MVIAERREALLRVLCRRRHETIANLAHEFGVSARTIRRDIVALSLDIPIYTQAGRYGGGIYMAENFQLYRKHFTLAELDLLKKIITYAKQKKPYIPSDAELCLLQQILSTYTKQKSIKELKED